MNERLQIEEKFSNCKGLKLITSESASKLGIIAEAPVFVSPIVSGHGLCSWCGAEYSPLVYSTGRLVESQHFHKNYGDEGGIFFYYNACRSELTNFGWVAMVKPIGELALGSAEKADILRIRAFCRPKCCDTELTSGILVSDDKLLLTPSCGDLDAISHREDILYEFKIQEGQVLFSQV